MLVETDPGLVALENVFLGSDPGCIYIAIKTPANVAGYWTGNAIIKSLKYSAPDNGVYTASISLTGTGTLTRN
jgi:predicted secreted protein